MSVEVLLTIMVVFLLISIFSTVYLHFKCAALENKLNKLDEKVKRLYEFK